MNTNAIAKLVKEVSARFDSNNITFHNAYSGRGMYGSNMCVAVSGSRGDCMGVIGEVIKSLHENDHAEFGEAVDFLMNFQRDQLGHDAIIYWSDLTVNCEDEDDDDDDGQPSESQEWESFDPDC
jgi:hypothetical protein